MMLLGRKLADTFKNGIFVTSDYVIIIIYPSPSTMSLLVQAYDSSDEDPTTESLQDSFNLAAISSTKRPKLQDTTQKATPQAAPDVLAEVGSLLSLFFFFSFLTKTRIHSTNLHS
jgi:hypothetical protein